MPGISSALDALLSWTAPLRETRCVACAVPVPASVPDRGGPFHTASNPALCPACEAALSRRTAGFCTRCGNLAAHAESTPAPCGDCLAVTRPWDRFFFHGVYQGQLRDIILRFKNGHELALARLLGTLLAGHPTLAGLTGHYDEVIPMPLHPRRLRERGFNQALELAKPLAERLDAPLEFARLARTGYTHPQAGLSLKERKRNVLGLFAAEDISGKRLLLVDDIATTCATLESAATALLGAGAVAVDVAVAARTPDHAAGYSV